MFLPCVVVPLLPPLLSLPSSFPRYCFSFLHEVLPDPPHLRTSRLSQHSVTSSELGTDVPSFFTLFLHVIFFSFVFCWFYCVCPASCLVSTLLSSMSALFMVFNLICTFFYIFYGCFPLDFIFSSWYISFYFESHIDHSFFFVFFPLHFHSAIRPF